MLKELSVKEALILLADKYPESIDCFCWDEGYRHNKTQLTGVALDAINKFRTHTGAYYHHCEIEIPDEYRYMTQQECIDWVCLHGYKGHQVRYNYNGSIGTWGHPSDYVYGGGAVIQFYEYRTISEIDGKIVYGEPMEFKVKVKNE